MSTSLRSGFSLAFLVLCAAGFAAQAGDAGESKQATALKQRAKAPAAADIDNGVTIDALLAHGDASDWLPTKAARLQGYVLQVEREDDGDYHLSIATNAGESDTHKWMLVEVTPAWSRRNHHLSGAKLHQLIGKKVEFTGWLYYEPDTEQTDPRGTRWEIHPVTDLSLAQ